MEGEYAVCFGKEPVGKLRIWKQGLYYRIDCRCCMTGGTVCRLMACGDGDRVNLGIPVPEGEGLRLITGISVKSFGKGPYSFRMVPKHDTATERLATIYPEEPYAYIARLKEVYLLRRSAAGEPNT